jgi:hypothetical protein
MEAKGGATFPPSYRSLYLLRIGAWAELSFKSRSSCRWRGGRRVNQSRGLDHCGTEKRERPLEIGVENKRNWFGALGGSPIDCQSVDAMREDSTMACNNQLVGVVKKPTMERRWSIHECLGNGKTSRMLNCGHWSHQSTYHLLINSTFVASKTKEMGWK